MQTLSQGEIMTCNFTLPEWQEDDRLDCEELQDRVERSQQVLGAEVEEKEGVQGQGDGDVVDEGDVEVALVRVPIAVFVKTVGLQPDGDEGHHGLDDAELKGCLERDVSGDQKPGHSVNRIILLTDFMIASSCWTEIRYSDCGQNTNLLTKRWSK